MRALLAAADSGERNFLRGVLENSGFGSCDVLVASSGAEAVEAVRSAEPAIEMLVAAWTLPGGEGFSLLRQLKKVPGGRQVAVLYCATPAERSAADPAPRWGLLGFAERPLQEAAFRERLRSFEGEIETRRIQERARRREAAAATGGGLPFFLRISSAAMEEFLERSVQGTYEAGTVFIPAGERVEFLNVLMGGTCSSGGRLIGTGDCLGEASFLWGRPQGEAVRAATRIHVASLSRPRLAELVRRHPDLEKDLAGLLSPSEAPPVSVTDSEFRQAHAVSFTDVILQLQRARESGTLRVSNGGSRGGVAVHGGEVSHAWTATRTGADAFHEMAGWAAPVFVFTSNAAEAPEEAKVGRSTMVLLMEAAGRAC